MSVTDEDLDWIREDTAVGPTIRSVLPGRFAVLGLLDLEACDEALLVAALAPGTRRLVAGWIVKNGLLMESGEERLLYARWPYRLRRIAAADLDGRTGDKFPDLLFPEDRSWLVSTAWDDSWRSIGADVETAHRIERALPGFARIGPDIDIGTTGRDVR